MIIKDGAGSGLNAKVNKENRLDVESVSRSIEQHINEKYKKTYTLSYDAIDPTGADDYFLYIKNTGTKNLHVTHIRTRTTVVGVVEIHNVTGTVIFGTETAITPENLTVGDSSTITAVTSADVNATGLANAGILFYQRLAVAATDYLLKIDAHIIIPPGQAIAFLWDTASGILSGNVTIYEDQGVT